MPGHHLSFDETPGYFGDKPCMVSGNAASDHYDPITPEASVEGTARSINMRETLGRDAPEHGNRAPGKHKKGDVSMMPSKGGY